MQTFLPYGNLESVKYLDRQRLGKQRVETFQILQALHGETKGWVNHPATRMWRGYENALVHYGLAVCAEWVSRGYKDTMTDRIAAYGSSKFYLFPDWFGNEDFHAAHRSNLLKKDPDHYRQFWPDEPDDLPYIWPVPKD